MLLGDNSGRSSRLLATRQFPNRAGKQTELRNGSTNSSSSDFELESQSIQVASVQA